MQKSFMLRQRFGGGRLKTADKQALNIPQNKSAGYGRLRKRGFRVLGKAAKIKPPGLLATVSKPLRTTQRRNHL
ncbi:hypothetical protein BWD10_02600 [Neisseria zoodegmatis]|uniref:Phage associated protein n=1 Tax=Neisseria zoodegmatis TaxID=326523 RepID=A0ABX3WI59_9NEIS|nr:hypothetical protein BWD10_02600 [Neisseria zoodegmatis]